MQGKGSCLCGKSTYTFDAGILATALCHCLDCRKVTSSTHSTALPLPSKDFTLDPSSPTKAKHHELGFPMAVTFCGECGTALFKTADDERFRNCTVVFAGGLDEPRSWMEGEEGRPQAEMWTKYKVDWNRGVEGARQCIGFD